MTINEAIQRADGLRPNAYTEDDKAVWANQVESSVQRDVMKLPAESRKYFKYPEDGDKELTLTGEWEELYVLFIVSMFDYWSQDTAKYNNSAKMYNDQFDAYKAQYIKEHPKRSSFVNLI